MKKRYEEKDKTFKNKMLSREQRIEKEIQNDIEL